MLCGLSAAAAENKPIPPECLALFTSGKVKEKDNCKDSSEVLKIDMGTFYCDPYCADYCNEIDFGIRISDLYPGLTEAEKKFVDENPKKAAKAFCFLGKQRRFATRFI